MSAMSSESSKLENEFLERNFSDNRPVEASNQQEIMSTTGYKPMAQEKIANDSVSDTDFNNKSCNEWTNKDVIHTVQSLTAGIVSKETAENFRVVNDILTIFPFVCGICDEKFQCISIYLKHISAHEEMNAYLHCCSQFDTDIEEKFTYLSCGMCNEKFPTLCTLYKHLIESESMHDFVFSGSEQSLHVFSENVGVVKNSSRETNVNLPGDNLNRHSLQYSGNHSDATNTENMQGKARNKSKKYKTRETISKKHRNCDISKSKDSHEEVDVNILGTGKKRTKRKDRTEMAVFSLSGDSSIDYIDDNEDKEELTADVSNEGIDDDFDDDDYDYETRYEEKVPKHSKKRRAVVNQTDEKFPCEICGAVFKQQYLQRHRRTHEERSLSCDQCENVYNCKFRLRTHIKQVHTEEKKYTCDECGKSFKAWPYLKQHRQVHIKERNILCPACPMKFKYAAVLRVHMKTHSDQKPYCCELCGMKFKRADLLTIHKKYHTEEKPYSCPECSKTFKVKQDMKKHFRIHLPPKFFCSVCGKSFVQKYNMRVHMKIHGDNTGI